MEFTLTALFVVLVIEQWKQIRKPLPFVIAAFSSMVALYLFSDQMLLGSIALSVTLLIITNFLENRHE
jgi:predicted branched-subunit amino acid permease